MKYYEQVLTYSLHSLAELDERLNMAFVEIDAQGLYRVQSVQFSVMVGYQGQTGSRVEYCALLYLRPINSIVRFFKKTRSKRYD